MYYIPYHEHRAPCTIFCIIRPVPDVFSSFHCFVMLIFSFNELELNLLRLQLHILTCLTIFLTHIQ